MRQLHDRYFRQAKREGKLARSVYKLEELNRRHRLFKRGGRVLDLGACPGSWLEFVLETVGPDGVACAVDLKPIHKKFKGRAHFLKADLTTLSKDAFDAFAPRFDAVLSDMAPNTSGVRAVDQARSLVLCEAALDWAVARLRRGGNFVCKIFDGPEVTAFRQRVAGLFDVVKMTKPDACRDESFEFYVVGLGRLPAAAAPAPDASPSSPDDGDEVSEEDDA